MSKEFLKTLIVNMLLKIFKKKTILITGHTGFKDLGLQLG